MIENNVIREESYILAEEILKDLDLSRLPLSNIVLKTGRLARLLNDFDTEKVFEYEASGYPGIEGVGIAPDVWQCAKLADRISKDAEGKETATTLSITAMEARIDANKLALANTTDPNISISSANPNQFVSTVGHGNAQQRMNFINTISSFSEALSKRRTYIYQYVKKAYIQLKFTALTTSVWASIKDKTDCLINELIPEETQKLTAIYEGLNDENPEKWATALTSCRRMIKALADKLYPASEKSIQKGDKKIKITEDAFINRLMCYIEENSDSQTLNRISNSDLRYIGDRLDSIYSQTCKGTHDNISKEEAEKCFLRTYIIVGDILDIYQNKLETAKEDQLKPKER